jgi:hypothetical protein
MLEELKKQTKELEKEAEEARVREDERNNRGVFGFTKAVFVD